MNITNSIKNSGLFILTLFCISTTSYAMHKDVIHPLFDLSDSYHKFFKSNFFPINSSASEEKYWLLALDGGGERGILLLETLARLEERTGKRIVDMFDGIAGTSIGGIIATLLTAPDPNNPSKPRYSPQQLLDIFFKERFVMFQPKWFSFGGLLRTKYKTRGMKSFLSSMLGSNTFKNRWLPTVLVTHDLNSYNMKLFSSIDNDDYFAKDIAMATAAAPTYYKPQHVFPVDKPHSEGHFVSDGGTCMSTPTHAGIAMFKKLYNAKPEQIHVLSLGTGISNTPLNNDNLRRGGGLSWLGVMIDLLMRGQQNVDVNIASLFLEKRYHRFNPFLPPALITFDNLSDTNGKALLSANQQMLKDREEEFSQIANALSKSADSKQTRRVQDLSLPVQKSLPSLNFQNSLFQNFFFWLIGWNSFQFEAQLVLRCPQTAYQQNR